MNGKKNGSGLGRRWRILRNLGITALLGVALWAGRGFPLPTAELRFEWAQRGALMADPAPLQGQVGSELVGANGRDIVVYSEGNWELRTFPRTPGPALVPLSDGVVAVDVPEGTASARLEVTVMALIIGVILGVVVAMIRTAHDQQRPGRRNPFLGAVNFVCKVYVTIIRGTPMMVQLLIMGLVIFASNRNKTLIGALSLGINSGAYVAEIIRGGLMSLDVGQTEAGRSLGLNYFDTMRFIVIPQAFKAILPALGNEFITLLKDTSLINVIGGKEIVYFAQAIITNTYEPMYPYLITAVMYLILVLIFTWLQGRLERRLRQSDRR